MADELVHVSTGGTLSQAEWEAIGRHLCNSQAARDIVYASSASQLSRLGAGTRGLGGGIVVVSASTPAGMKAIADYVCTGTSVADDDAVIINTALAAADDAYAGVPVRMIGKFYTKTSINLTSAQHKSYLDMRGAHILASTNGAPVIDMTASHVSIIQGGQITGQTINPPNVGILQARLAAGWSSGHHKFFGLSMGGDYTVAAIYNYGSEENTYVGGSISNNLINTAVMIIDPNNTFSITSPYQTIYSGDISTTGNWFYNTIFQMCGAGTGSAIYLLSGASSPNFDVRFFGGEAFSSGAYGVRINLAAASMYGLTFDGIRITDLIPTYAYYAGDAGAARVLGNVAIRGGIAQAGTKEIYTGANITPDRWIVDRTNRWPDVRGFTFTVAATNGDIYGP